MVDPVTPLIGYAQPTRGSDAGTWDLPLNGNSSILDNMQGLVTAVALTNANVTLTSTQCQSNVIRFTGALTGNVIVTFPLQKFYVIDNLTTGAFTLTMTTGAGGAKVVSTPQGSRKTIFSDGTDMKWANEDDPGTLKFMYGTSLPLWMSAFTLQPWFICDGSTFAAGTYPILNTILGGNTLPDMRGRFPAAYDPTSLRLTAPQIAGNTLGAGGGEQLHTLVSAELPATNLNHSHPVKFNGPVASLASGAFAYGFGGSPPVFGTGSSSLGNTDSATLSFGSGTSHNTVPPALIVGVMLIKS